MRIIPQPGKQRLQMQRLPHRTGFNILHRQRVDDLHRRHTELLLVDRQRCQLAIGHRAFKLKHEVEDIL